MKLIPDSPTAEIPESAVKKSLTKWQRMAMRDIGAFERLHDLSFVFLLLKLLVGSDSCVLMLHDNYCCLFYSSEFHIICIQIAVANLATAKPEGL